MTRTVSSTRDVARDIACSLTDPSRLTDRDQPAQSLAGGAVGITLLHSERASTGDGDWAPLHAWLTAATRGEITVGGDAGLFFGAPACAFAAHAAATARPDTLTRALAQLDTSTTTLTRQRLTAAHDRLDRGGLCAFGEYDLMRGLTGLGVYHLRRHPDSEITRAVLSYLVRLSHPRRDGLPGWWTHHAPVLGETSPEFAHGHANLGLAHGITGPLALLSLALRRGIVVDGHTDALGRICAWLDIWQQPHPSGPWWPYWITRAHTDGDTPITGPGRPSWYYGTPGLARAQQLAALALGDTTRQHLAETAMLGCLTDPDQLARITEPGLCHGMAGLLQTTWRMATDNPSSAITSQLPRLATALTEQLPATRDPEFLTGTAGAALALHTTATNTASRTGWDACLLLT